MDAFSEQHGQSFRSIRILDTAAESVTETLIARVPARDVAAGRDSGHVFTLDGSTGWLAKVDTSNGHSLAETHAGTDPNGPQCLATTPDGWCIVSGLRDSQLWIHDFGVDEKLRGVIALERPAFLAVSSDGRVFVAHSPDEDIMAPADSISVIDISGLTVTPTVQTAVVTAAVKTARPFTSFTVSPDGSRIYGASAPDGKSVLVFSAKTSELIDEIPVAAGRVDLLAISPDGLRLYAASPTSDLVAVITISTG
ncbi:PD40 domain-containing protein [Nocardia abscessus]|uniref:WD40 repeat domain-containing protein n=1 Tax=Nocardia abscessus TaxID=120957 RepID=UPI001893463C|nr:PD40 domain-containing protein [Nocardia abscessus]MBF6339709.1 PD40 domain-containing protein [Nocardia abscessus]